MSFTVQCSPLKLIQWLQGDIKGWLPGFPNLFLKFFCSIFAVVKSCDPDSLKQGQKWSLTCMLWSRRSTRQGWGQERLGTKGSPFSSGGTWQPPSRRRARGSSPARQQSPIPSASSSSGTWASSSRVQEQGICAYSLGIGNACCKGTLQYIYQVLRYQIEHTIMPHHLCLGYCAHDSLVREKRTCLNRPQVEYSR